jgi:hypothetical protein
MENLFFGAFLIINETQGNFSFGKKFYTKINNFLLKAFQCNLYNGNFCKKKFADRKCNKQKKKQK